MTGFEGESRPALSASARKAAARDGGEGELDKKRAALRAIVARHADREPVEQDRVLADRALNDMGNGDRLIARRGRDMIYVPELTDGWFKWEGRYWQPDPGDLSALSVAQRVARDIWVEAQAMLGDDYASSAAVGELVDHARASGNAGKIKGMLSVAAPHLRRLAAEVDANHGVIVTETETLVLRAEGEVVSARAPSRDDLSTRMAPVRWDPDADCPEFERFLARVQPDPAVQRFLARWFGVCLTGHQVQHVLMLYGSGANGKSTLLNIIRGVLGAYCMTLDFASLTDDNRGGGGSNASPDLARLPGARLVTASEPKVGAPLSESVIKKQTGGEPMVVRQLNKPPFEFTPTHKLVLSFNKKPEIKSTDYGTWRRILMVPWRVTIPEAERDDHFAERLIAREGAGIFRWLVDGWREFAEVGLAPPDAVRAETEVWRTESDPVGEFIEDCITRLPPGRWESLPAKDVFIAWKEWAALNGHPEKTQKWFGGIFGERDMTRDKHGGKSIYRGIEFSEVGEALFRAGQQRGGG